MVVTIAGQAEREKEPSSPYRPHVLVVEREVRARAALSRCLESLGCRVLATDTVVGALDAVEHRPFDLAFVDPSLEIELDRDLASRLLDEIPGISLILIGSCANLESKASERVRDSCGHLPTAFSPGQIKQFVDRFCEQRMIRHRVADYERRLRPFFVSLGIVAESAAMRNTMEIAASASRSVLPVVLRGEFGTEHESLARFIHKNSAHASGPFVSALFLDSGDEDMAAQLLGRGTGVSGRGSGHPGLIEEADGGTLFLGDEGEIPPFLCAPLQRLLRCGEFERVGELRVRHASVRIVASTAGNAQASHEVLGALFGQGCEPIWIDVPPLRDRREDLLPTARGFVDTFARSLHKGPLFLTEEVQQAVKAYSWPGNTAELRNAIEHAVIHSRSGALETRDFPERMLASSVHAPQLGGDFSLDEIEREHIRRVAGRAPSELAAAAVLGISRSTLWRRRGSPP